MPEADAATYRYHPFDLTKVWPHKDYPLIEVGVMELNRNPENYFAEVEQAAFNSGQRRARASASRPTRCCRAGCSPTATRSATGWASTTTRSRSTAARLPLSTATTATVPCASTATRAAVAGLSSRTTTAGGPSSPPTASRR